MKTFYEVEYTVYNEQVRSFLNTNTNRNIREMSLSDLHYCSLIPQEKLDAIVKYARYKKPDHILFVGDSWDSVGDIASAQAQDILANFFGELAQIAPVLIELASHDWWLYTPPVNKDDEIGKREDPVEFLARLNSLNNVYVLDNTSYEDEDVFIVGYTQGFEYYYPNGAHVKSLLHPNEESKEVMMRELTELNSKIVVPEDKISEILIHALATYGFDEKIMSLNAPYMYRYGGHYHYGMIHPFYDERHPDTSGGIVTPDRVFHAPNCRRTFRTREDHNIICGPLTMFSRSSHLNVFNRFYPMYSTILNITNNRFYNTELVHTTTNYVKTKRL